MNEKPANYRVGIENIPAHFVTPIAFAIRRWIEDKSEWSKHEWQNEGDKKNISDLVDQLIFFEKLDEEKNALEKYLEKNLD